MSWEILLLIFFGGFVGLMLTGMPIAFAFILMNIIALISFFGFDGALHNLIYNIFGSVTIFTFLPLPLFILMGEVMYHGGTAPSMITALEKIMGRVPGRLSLLAIIAGVLFSNLSGSSIGGAAILGSIIAPDMESRGYKKPMILGPIIAGGGLAALIPPTGLGILVGAVGAIPIGPLLVALYIPGLLLALLYLIYIFARCKIQPEMAPAYDVGRIGLSEKILSFFKYVLPVGFIFFMVIGLMFLGVATPTEAAAAGALASFILVAVYKKLTWEVIKKSFKGTNETGAMVFMIIVGASAFGGVIAYSGATTGLVEMASSLPFPPIVIIILMQIVVLVMGCFMDPIPITLIALPIYMPIIQSLGFSPIWFGVTFLLNIELAAITPPFGLVLFVLKNVTRANSLRDIYNAAYPVVLLQMLAMALLISFPGLSLWLPSLMLNQ